MHLRRFWMLVVLALVVMCLGLAACGGYAPNPGNGGTPGSTPTSSGY